MLSYLVCLLHSVHVVCVISHFAPFDIEIANLYPVISSFGGCVISRMWSGVHEVPHHSAGELLMAVNYIEMLCDL